MQSVRVLENITFCSLFTNRLRPFHDFNHHTVTSINHLFLFSSEMVSRSRCFMLVMIFASFSDSFKYFHTADTFAALVRESIWLRHVIVRYNLFGLFAYSAEHRKSIFCYFRPNNFGCRTFGASLVFRGTLKKLTATCLVLYSNSQLQKLQKVT